jgi:hypothetical protein
MKLVFKLEEVAAALGKTENEFLAIQDKLEAAGFPRPVRIHSMIAGQSWM